MMALASTGIALAGLGLAWLVYRSWTKQGVDKKEPLRMAGPVHRLLSEKYYMDALYEGAVVRRFFYRGFAGTLDWLDRNLVDGVVDLFGWLFRNFGPLVLSRIQTGQVQTYGAVVVLGGLAILLGFLLT